MLRSRSHPARERDPLRSQDAGSCRARQRPCGGLTLELVRVGHRVESYWYPAVGTPIDGPTTVVVPGCVGIPLGMTSTMTRSPCPAPLTGRVERGAKNTTRTHRGPIAATGLGAFATAWYLARERGVSASEGRAFWVLNRSIGAAERPAWAVMQFGNAAMAGVAPIALRAAGRSWPESARAGLAAAGGWHLAKGVKRLVARPRPNELFSGVVLRDGNPTGRGFVSGHSAVAMAVAVATLPLLDGWQRPAAFGTAMAVGLARVHVGAHLPLDVVGGLALGAVWGSVCAPRSRSEP